jgi:hypothetical protein
VDNLVAAALPEEATIARPIRDAAVASTVTPESRSEKIERVLLLIDGGMSVRKVHRECGITRQLIRTLVSYTAYCIILHLVSL